MNKEKKILFWFIGTFLLPPISWLISAWYYNVWNTEEMFKILFRINIPGYVLVFASIIYFIVKAKIKDIKNYYTNPQEETLLKAQKSAYFLPRFFMIILPIYTTLGDFPVLLPLDFIDKTEFILGILIGVPIVFLFAIPFYITMNKHLEEFTYNLPFSDKYKPLSISNKLTIVFLFSVIGITVFYISAVLGVLHNNKSMDLSYVLVVKLAIGSFVIIGLTILNLQLFRRQILKPLNKMKERIFKMADGKGDLSQRLLFKSRDELGEMAFGFNQYVEHITKLISEMHSTINSVLHIGSELNTVSEKIAERAAEQAVSIEEIATSMEEMLAQIESNTENASITSEISTKSSMHLSESNKIFMQTINYVSEISTKINIISEIADKTDILSINAAIEAARSGAGSGFAVIAKEIRNLADNTKKASEEISDISESGQKISQTAKVKLEQLIPEILKSANLVNQIVDAGKSQVQGVVSINTAMQQLSDITNNNSSAAEEMSGKASVLKQQAEELKKTIAFFNIKL